MFFIFGWKWKIVSFCHEQIYRYYYHKINLRVESWFVSSHFLSEDFQKYRLHLSCLDIYSILKNVKICYSSWWLEFINWLRVILMGNRLVETHIFSFVVGRAFVTDIEKLKISSKTRSLDVAQVLKFFSEVTKVCLSHFFMSFVSCFSAFLFVFNVSRDFLLCRMESVQEQIY